MKKILLILAIFSANTCFSQDKSYYTQPNPTNEISKVFQTNDKKIWYIDNQHDTTLSFSFLPQGIYTFRVKKERTTSIVKVVIQF